MSDNPDILQLGIEPDDEGFDALNQQLDTVESGIQGIDQAIQSVNQVSDAPLQAVSDKFDRINKQVQDTNDSLNVFRQQLGDMPDLGSDGGGDTGGGGGSGGFGLSRAFSSAGMLARRAGMSGVGEGLQDVGAIVRVEQAFGRLTDQLGGLNQVVEESPGLLSPLVEGLSQLGVPMAGLTAVALPAGLALVGLGAELSDFLGIINKGRDDVNKAESGLVDYYKLVESSTSEEINKKLKSAQIDKDAADQALQVNKDKITGLVVDATKNLPADFAKEIQNGIQEYIASGGMSDVGKKALANLDVNGDIAELPGIHSLLEATGKLSVGSSDAAARIAQYNQALGDSHVKANDAAEAEKKLQQARDQAADRTIQLAQEVSQLEATGTSKGVQDRIDSIEAEKKAINDELATAQLSSEKRAELTQRLTDLSNEETALHDTVLPLVAAREAEQKAAKDTQKAIDDITKAHDTYTKAISDAKTQLNNQIQAATLRESQQEQAETPGSLQDTQAREHIRTEESRKETELTQQTADKIVDIRAREGQAEAQVSLNLSRQFEDDTINANERLGKMQRDAQQTAQIDAMNHEARLSEIRDQAKENELDDIENRDFAKLAKDMQAVQQQTTKEDQKYARQEQQLSAHLQHEEQELGVSLEQQREAQQRAAVRRLEDLQISLNAEIQQTGIDEDRKRAVLQQSMQYQLDDLSTAENYKIEIMRIGLQNQIALYQQAEQQRMQITLQTQAAIVSQSVQQIAQMGLSHPELLIANAPGLLNAFQQTIVGLFSQ